jgi:hypothetical protein
VWRLPGNRVLELGSVKEPGDWIKYQGRPHDAKCVGLGTPVLMVDGTYKAIESIAVGDMVATLEGPKAVTKTFVMRKQAVTAIASVNGKVVANQVQSRSHRVLASSGWVCQDMWKDRGASSPTQPRFACISEESSLLTSGQTSSIPQAKYLGLEQQQAQRPNHEGYQSQSGFYVGAETSGQESDCEGFECPPSAAVPRSLASGLQAHQSPFAGLSEQDLSQPCALHGATCVLSESSLADCLGDYLSGPRHNGGQLHADQVHDRQCLLLQVSKYFIRSFSYAFIPSKS